MTPPARAVWRFLRREGDDYWFFQMPGVTTWHGWVRRVPVGRFWGGAR